MEGPTNTPRLVCYESFIVVSESFIIKGEREVVGPFRIVREDLKSRLIGDLFWRKILGEPVS